MVICDHGFDITALAMYRLWWFEKDRKVYVDDWVNQISKMLHEGVIYRHIVLTLPEILRDIFYNHAEGLLGPLMQIGVRYLDDFFLAM